jgi:putative phage-type endonuclease
MPEQHAVLEQLPISTAPDGHPTHPATLHLMQWAAQFPQPAQKSEEWKNQRAKYCTASQHAAALGRCPYKSRSAALRQYGGVIGTEFTGNVATRHGEAHEDDAVSKYEKMRNVKVHLFGMLPFLDNHAWLGGSPDGITSDGILVEVKCPYRRKPNGTVPPHYMPQIQSMMHGFDLPLCHFVEYVPATAWTDEIFHVNEVARCPRYWEEALPLLEQFWADVGTLRKADVQEFTLPAVAPTKRKRAPRDIPACAITLARI